MGRRERCTEPECPYVGKRPPQDGCECARDEMPDAAPREPLTIYVCPVHGFGAPVNGGTCLECARPMAAARVFREEEVRPLWETLMRHSTGYLEAAEAHAVCDAFPALEDWGR